MFSRWTYALVGALFASIALFGSVATASAGEQTEAASTTAGRRPPPNIDPDLRPRQAADISALCRRLAQSDVVSEELAKRCREAFDGHSDDGHSLAEACRRLAHSDVVNEELAERCRNAFDGRDSDGHSLSEACRRLAQSDVVSEELAERCREAFDGDDGHSLSEACRRLAHSDVVNEELAERCRNAFEGHDDTPDHARRAADHATDPRERPDTAGIAPRTPAR